MTDFLWLLVLPFVGLFLGLIAYFFARAFDNLWGADE